VFNLIRGPTRILSVTLESALIVDNDPGRRRRLCDILQFMGFGQCTARAATADVAVGPATGNPDICLVGDCGGAQARAGVVRSLRVCDARLPVFVLGGEPPDGELQALVLGQLAEPLEYAELQDALGRARAMRHAGAPGARTAGGRFRALVGNSRAITGVRAAIDRVAPGDAPVLFTGESGTGKEVAARNVHYRSARRDGPFVHLNCGAVPPALVEAELFGAAGRFAQARGGTLFLDGISETTPTMQARLLQVIEEGRLRLPDGTGPVELDFRLLSAARQDLERAVSAGSFRAELYYRLNVFPIHMPALRDRVEDIPLLVHELIARMEHSGSGSVRFTPVATVALCAYPWPGNVRELANLVERMAILHPGQVVDLHDLPQRYRGPVSSAAAYPGIGQLAGDPWRDAPRLPRDGLDLREHMFALEQELIQQALDQVNGVVTHAARLLRMRRTTLVERLRRHGRGGRDNTAGSAPTRH